MYSMKDTVAADLGVSLPGRKILKGPLKRPAAKAAVIVEADIEAQRGLTTTARLECMTATTGLRPAKPFGFVRTLLRHDPVELKLGMFEIPGHAPSARTH